MNSIASALSKQKLFCMITCQLFFMVGCSSYEIDFSENKQQISQASMQHATQSLRGGILGQLTGNQQESGHYALRSFSFFSPNSSLSPHNNQQPSPAGVFSSQTSDGRSCYLHFVTSQGIPRDANSFLGDWKQIYRHSLSASQAHAFGDKDSSCLYLYDGQTSFNFEFVLHFDTAQSESRLQQFAQSLQASLAVIPISTQVSRFNPQSSQNLLNQGASWQIASITAAQPAPVQDIIVRLQGRLPLEYTMQGEFGVRPENIEFAIGWKQRTLGGQSSLQVMHRSRVFMHYQ